MRFSHTKGRNRSDREDDKRMSRMWQVLISGTRDYIHKCGFQKVLLGLSGGIDSSLIAAIAVEALGEKNVLGVSMPSIYTSKQSMEDAKRLGKNLRIKILTLPINDIVKSYATALKGSFAGFPEDVTEENLQSRIRSTLLMALSNKFHALLLATGNKSELATGYCTLYGDLAGGLAPLGDVFKTEVYILAKWLNKRKGDMIPASILEKEPSAELKPGQKDTDALPPYQVLDRILKQYLESGKSAEEIAKDGIDRVVIEKVIKMIKKSEFKRKQAPPSLAITDSM